MLYTVLTHIRNFFPSTSIKGNFSVKGGSLELPLKTGQYFLIGQAETDSVFNIGVHEYPAELKDEDFKGAIVGLAIPDAVIDLVADIEKFCKDNPESPYQSESFADYSYTKATVNGKPLTWQVAFKERLDAWRKI